jgi:outer membrane protein W
MKKVVGFILFVAASMAVTAQNTSFGPTIGINNSWINNTNSDNLSRDSKVGLNIGANLTYSVSNHWAFGGDVKFSMEGAKVKFVGSLNGLPANVTGDLKANYIRVPLKATYFFGKHGKKFRPKLYAGPSFGFFLGGSSDLNGTSTDSKNYINSFDFALLVGTGFNYRLTSSGTWLNVDFGYTNGFSNLIKTTNATLVLPQSSYNRNLALNVGVNFPLGSTKSTKKK